jgi:hypothetical protein
MTFGIQTKTGTSTRVIRAILDDGAETTVHIAQYSKHTVRPQIVMFDTETNLLHWCKDNDVEHAVTGGFFLREQRVPLGDTWIDGRQLAHEPFLEPYKDIRGSLCISESGGVTLAERNQLPKQPLNLLQAGPLLLKDKQIMVWPEEDLEGFSAGAEQFDSDITDGRYPRTAIATDEDHLYLVACDGRTSTEAGLTLTEFAQVLWNVGAYDALNLDGGSSAAVISEKKLLNNPTGVNPDGSPLFFPESKPIFSAVVLNNY